MQQFEDKINSLIGREYNANTWHCWHLVCELVPCAPRIEASVTCVRDAIRAGEVPINKMEFVKIPRNGCVVMLGSRHSTMHHAGVYYNDGVVHADKVGTRYEKMEVMEKKYTYIRFLRCK